MPPRPRQRGDKQPLSLDAVIDAALACLREGGPAGLTMRKVAARLDTGAGSLYAYVADQRELSVLVLDAIAARLPAPGSAKAPESRFKRPEDRVVALLLAYAELLMQYPGSARLAMLATPTGPASLGLLDRILGLLMDGSSAPDRAAWALDSLTLLVTATIAEQDARDAATTGVSIPMSYEQALDATDVDLPHLRATRASMFAGHGKDRLEWAIRTFLAGMRA